MGLNMLVWSLQGYDLLGSYIEIVVFRFTFSTAHGAVVFVIIRILLESLTCEANEDEIITDQKH